MFYVIFQFVWRMITVNVRLHFVVGVIRLHLDQNRLSAPILKTPSAFFLVGSSELICLYGIRSLLQRDSNTKKIQKRAVIFLTSNMFLNL